MVKLLPERRKRLGWGDGPQSKGQYGAEIRSGEGDLPAPRIRQSSLLSAAAQASLPPDAERVADFSATAAEGPEWTLLGHSALAPGMALPSPIRPLRELGYVSVLQRISRSRRAIQPGAARFELALMPVD
jgi:hypothetical protein